MKIFNNKKIVVISILLIISLVLGVMGFSYSFFYARVIGEGSQNVIVSGDLNLSFTDNISISSLVFPGDYIEKTFEVTNESEQDLYYDIGWESLDNEFINDEMVISLSCTSYINYGTGTQAISGTCANLADTPIGIISEPIYPEVAIGIGKTHVYTVRITFIDTGLNQDANKGKMFNGKLAIVGTFGNRLKWYEECDGKNTMKCKILADNPNPAPDTIVNFALPSSTSRDLGLYWTYDTNLTEDLNGDGLGERIYYYRGAVTNNYLVFAEFCWRIIRTNENGSIRLRYGGVPTISGSVTSCPQTGTLVSIAEVAYNNLYSDNRYVGYMFGNSCDTYEECHSNDLPSNMKEYLEGWFIQHLDSYSRQIEDAVYCSDRTIADGIKYRNLTNLKTGVGTDVTFYGVVGRLAKEGTGGWEGSKADAQPTYKCERLEDKFTVSSVLGNGKNNRPIGLLTGDEASYAGGVVYSSEDSDSNTSYYLYIGENPYWTMSPSHFHGSPTVLGISRDGEFQHFGTQSISSGVLPVISLIPGTLHVSGDGTYNNPYFVE